MNLSGLLPFLQNTTTFQELVTSLEQARPDAEAAPLRSLGLPPTARTYVAASVYASANRPMLLVAGRSDRAQALVEELRAWLGEKAPVHLFREPDSLPYERIPWSEETIRDRLGALAALSPSSSLVARKASELARRPIIVASARALLSKTLPPREFRATDQFLYRGQRVSLATLSQALVAAGYDPVSVVESRGTFSMRGGIVDIFSSHAAYPVRMELWGEEVDSLRLFDAVTQRSLRQTDSYRVVPASEALPGPAKMVPERAAKWDFSNCHGAAAAEIQEELDRLAEGMRFRGIEFYIPYVYSSPVSVLQYLTSDALIMIEDWQELRAVAHEFEEQAEAIKAELEAGGDIPKGIESPAFSWDDIQPSLESFTRVELAWGGEEEVEGELQALFAPAPHFGGQLRVALDHMAELAQQKQPIVVASRQAQRLSSLLDTYSVGAPVLDDVPADLPDSSVVLIQGFLDGGWRLRNYPRGEFGLTFLTDSEIFGWVKPEPRRARQRRGVTSDTFFADVKPGDYVVHIDQGIGIFRGLVKLDVDGEEREYLQVDYQGTDKLYLPIDQADRLSRYVGATDRPPALSRLGTADWSLVKARARRAVKSVAKELLELYSVREVIPGHAYAEDTEWQGDLEAAFPYVETEDQTAAIAAVKADMERPHPADRLICGDVGYGKTEVALRAAFKAVMESKQVALLVPTTVLAQQHFETFRERMKPFPVTVEMLSRFRSKKEQKEVLEGLATGRVDIVIGTHRLLQKDVQFKDLGLLIVDEEQRFGVIHKEWLKQKRREVDVLTLTATPIPRTLYMALAGARDMSTIDTPPEERLPIKTYVGEYDENLIRRAILRELNRGGQVYFVHNRVQGIRQIAQRVARVVPEAHIGIAHGQMPEGELETVMLDFADARLDVLVCTSIIESGLDIPNANTIIINRADQFGLAQLYQLRGRVGRSAQRAYAYLLYPKHQPLSSIARKRLDTIMQASELGAGFRIAMRDLEIRGAGELLGARQHGHISAVGFDLYCRLLAQSVQEVKGEAAPALMDETALYLRPLEAGAQLNLPLKTFIPEDYIQDEDVRIQLYRRLSAAGAEELDQLAGEMQDRFGALPQEVQDLLFLMRVKAVATQCDVRVIGQEAEQIVVRAPWLYGLEGSDLRNQLPAGARLGRGQIWLARDDAWQQRLEQVLSAMNAYHSVQAG